MKVTDLAMAVSCDAKHKLVGIRPGEKLHEEMITASDSGNTVDLGDRYAILPTSGGLTKEQYCKMTGAIPVPEGFSYNSGENEYFLTPQQLKKEIKAHVSHRNVKYL